MKIKTTESLHVGDILAAPVFNKEQEILIPSGVELKNEYIQLLLNLHIPVVQVMDPFEDFETVNFLISNEKKKYFVDGIQKILEGHIYNLKESLTGLENLSQEIVDYMEKEFDPERIYDYPQRVPDLYTHTVMVCLLALGIGEKKKMSQKEKKELALGCLLHDLGIRYITVPYENLNFESMSIEDAHEFKKHTVLGYAVVENENWLPDSVKKMILSHHERMDGSGYPLKEKSQQIYCNILQLCDELDSKISGTESVRESMDRIMDEIKEGSGTRFQGELSEHMFSFLSRYPVGTEVRTNSMERGIVVSQTKDHKKPILMKVPVQENVKNELVDLSIEKEVWIQEILD